MPLDVFRRLNPRLMERYQVFFHEQLKYQHEKTSDIGWTNGLYVGRAISSCFPKGRKYPDEPLELWVDGNTTEEVCEPFTDADKFAGFAAVFNRNNGLE